MIDNLVSTLASAVPSAAPSPVAVYSATGDAAASTAAQFSWLVIAIPLVSAGLLLVIGRAADRWGHILGLAAPTASFVIGLWAFFDLLSRPVADRVQDISLVPWIAG
ncbi:MAG: hypothetical protein LBG11_02505, partial [Bifidobacteriaceae bacterium]|nr:hypothetical protein [Bifidobacteriaceae bacterium]